MDAIGTFAEGLATRYSFDLTFGILKRELDDIVTLTERSSRRAFAWRCAPRTTLRKGPALHRWRPL